MKKNITTIIIIALAAVFLLRGLVSYKSSKATKILPYFGNKDIASNGKDTIYHYVSEFSFINQEGKIITQKNLDGGVYVADYFFTTCQSICPIMSNEMEFLANHFKDNTQVKFISYTVNPENDSVPVLADYALAHHANPQQWFLVTGSKKELYDLARQGYYLNTDSGDGGPNDFIHTQSHEFFVH